MVLIWLCQALFGAATLALCARTCHAVLRRDPRAHFFLTAAGSLALVFFVSVPGLRLEMTGVSLVAIAAGVLMAPAPDPAVSLDSTATRKSRR